MATMSVCNDCGFLKWQIKLIFPELSIWISGLTHVIVRHSRRELALWGQPSHWWRHRRSHQRRNCVCGRWYRDCWGGGGMQTSDKRYLSCQWLECHSRSDYAGGFLGFEGSNALWRLHASLKEEKAGGGSSNKGLWYSSGFSLLFLLSVE